MAVVICVNRHALKKRMLSETEIIAFSEEGISKLAFVGDEKWKVEIFMFTGKPMRHTAIEYFPQDQFDQAQAWLSE